MATAEAPAQFDTRVITDAKGNKTEFNFFRIDSPEKWLEAETYVNNYEFPVGGRRLSMALRSLAYGEWEKLEYRYPMPPRPDSVADQADFNLKRDQAMRRRWVTVMELSTGKPVPGADIEAKADWISQLGTGEVEALFDQIIDVYSNVQDGTLIQSYNAMSQVAKGDVVQMDSMDDWLKQSQVGSTFRMQRPFENFIVEFPLRQFTDKAKAEIEDRCRDPLPPGKPGKNPLTGMPDTTKLEYNWDDAGYLETVKANGRVKLVMQIAAVLPFTIPGEDAQQQYNWLAKRMLGDVIKLRAYIQNELIDYKSRLNFF